MNSKIESLRNSVGKIYLGDWLIDIYNDDQLKKEIHRLADIELNSLVKNKKSLYTLDEILIVSLVIIALEKYDSNFYDHLLGFYPQSYSNNNISDQTINSRVREAIRQVFSKENKSINQEESRIINDILKQSFVPLNYLSSFYDFVYDIYKYNYDYSIDFSLESELSGELKGLFAYLFNNDDVSQTYELKIGNSIRSYMLIKSTRDVLSDDFYCYSAITLVINILKIIDAYFYQTEFPSFINNKYYIHGFEKWKASNYLMGEAKTQLVKGSKNPIILKPFVKHFDYSNQCLIIQTRRHILNDFHPNDSLEIIVKNNGNVVCRDTKLVVKEIMGGIRIEPKEIKVNNFLGSLEYSLLHNGIEIYNSRRIIDDNVMLFDNVGTPLTKDNDYIGNIFLITNMELKNTEFINTKFKYGNIYIGPKKIDTIFNFETYSLAYTKKMETSIDGEIVQYLECLSEDKIVPVFNRINKLIVESSDENKEKIIIRIFDKNIKIPPDKILVTKNGNKIYFLIDINFIEMPNDYYEILILKGSKGRLGKFNFILDEVANIEEVYNRYTGLSINLVCSFSEDISVHQTPEELELSPLKSLEISFVLHGKEFYFRNILRCTHYIINEEKYFLTHKVWFEDIIEGISIINVENEVVIYEYKGDNIYQQSVKDSNLLFISRDRLLDIAIFNRVETGMIEIILKKIRGIKIQVLFGDVINEGNTGIFNEDNNYYFNIDFWGKNLLEFKLYLDKIVIFEKLINRSTRFAIPIKSDHLFTINISEQVVSIMNELEYVELYNSKFYKFSQQKISRSIFSIISAHNDLNNQKIEIKNTSVENISFVNGNCTAELYYHTYNGSYSMANINPVNIEFITDVIYDSEFFYKEEFIIRIVDRDYDGLLINSKKNEIHQVGYGKHLTDADSFRIKLKREG